jgi:hypothetical protein
MLRHLDIGLIIGVVITPTSMEAAARSAPEGQLTIAFDTSVAPMSFDPTP